MILLISAVFPPEPVVAAYIGEDIAAALSEKWVVKVLTPIPSRPKGFHFSKEPVKNKKFEHIVLESFVYPKSRILGRILESYSFGKHAVKYIKKNQSNIQCIYIKAWPLIAQYLIVRMAKKYSIPAIIHIQDIYPESLLDKLPFLKKLFFRLLIPIDKYTLQNSSKVITISPKMKKYLLESRDLKSYNVELVYNWQNEGIFLSNNNTYKKTTIGNTFFTFMFLGSLSKTAGVDLIISAFRNIGLQNSRLVIAGNGSEKKYLISMANSYKGSSIEFWDAPPEKVPMIQNKADVLILSLKKGASQFAFPSKIIAYMLSEKPIIACIDEDSNTAIAIKQANCGWIIPPEDIDELAKTMVSVVSIKEKILRVYGRNGFDYAMNNYSKKVNLQKILTIINEVIRK